ncbi:hemolysin-type calcium-binding repeat family protein [Synechococcus sp. BIOS-U3-1]|uniref:calcium-binding protein n=1 Tax=Synechococcus sp. BIOS-U3-1 TaxID=1400865 RepID=UPI0016466BA4|nr:calcium-binding protein [Synechococcus sp. BIOS-U3-1]QNI58159.1 hemolysin-type calcium-binding repeat family protein [Synechococcus sp. BIOS-U3-1]
MSAATITITQNVSSIKENTDVGPDGLFTIEGTNLAPSVQYSIYFGASPTGNDGIVYSISRDYPTLNVGTGNIGEVDETTETVVWVDAKVGTVPIGTTVLLNGKSIGNGIPGKATYTVENVPVVDNTPAPIDNTPAPSPVNFTGSEGRDITNGGDLNDELRGFGGDDQLNGGGGDDFINGNVGNDYIIGAQGNDYLMGGSENDDVRGGSGNDFTNGNRGNDFVFGGNGNDTVRGGSEDDVIYGGAGNDSLYGDKGNDVLYGELGSDIFNLSTGNDIIQDFEVGVDSFNLNGVLNLSFTQTDDGALATYDGGSTLFSGVDNSVLV